MKLLKAIMLTMLHLAIMAAACGVLMLIVALFMKYFIDILLGFLVLLTVAMIILLLIINYSTIEGNEGED